MIPKNYVQKVKYEVWSEAAPPPSFHVPYTLHVARAKEINRGGNMIATLDVYLSVVIGQRGGKMFLSARQENSRSILVAY
jgi:hypothetical protein